MPGDRTQRKDIDDLLRFEERHSAGASFSKLPFLDANDAALFSFLQIGNEGRRAEVQTLTGKPNAILKLRTLLFRGRHEEARKLIEKAEHELRTETDASSSAKAELALEDARRLIFEGRWQECHERCTEALSLGPVPLSLMTTYQVRALSLFEQGKFRDALEDLESADSLISVFSDAQSSFYASILRFRVLGKLRPGAPVSARIEELSSLLGERELNPDFLLTLLRAEIECRADAGGDAGMQALACYRLSELMGDRLYSALALLEIASFAEEPLRELLAPLITAASEKFPRVRLTRERIPARGPSISLGAWKRGLLATHLVLGPQRRLVQLDPWSVHELPSSSQPAKVLQILAQGSLSKSDFFRALWGPQKYAPHLHDGLIWNAIHRLRSRLHLEISIEAGLIEAKSVLFLGSQRSPK